MHNPNLYKQNSKILPLLCLIKLMDFVVVELTYQYTSLRFKYKQNKIVIRLLRKLVIDILPPDSTMKSISNDFQMNLHEIDHVIFVH